MTVSPSRIARLEETIPRVVLSTTYPYGFTAKVISSDESTTYRVIALADDDGTLWHSCSCMGHRTTGTPANPCKHVEASTLVYARRPPEHTYDSQSNGEAIAEASGG